MFRHASTRELARAIRPSVEEAFVYQLAVDLPADAVLRRRAQLLWDWLDIGDVDKQFSASSVL